MVSEPVPVPAPKYRWADFIALDEDDLRELIDGQLLEVEVPSKAHESLVALLIAFLVNWARANGGRVLASSYRVRISDTRGVMPDVQFFRKGREDAGGERGLEDGAPDLVVEVVSSSSKKYDRVVKLNWYALIGAPEYWIVDPELRTLERLVLEGANFVVKAALTDDATFAPDTFPGLEIPLAELFGPPGTSPAPEPGTP